ncbi:Putative uncharacterized protein [Taphrina deformans PYCC 5710]|uniref:Hpc2-related domain-containing protein n=1 Tax=Taphrina deformans (strain PYCC 5710 / ATCC 11124 / CBS 356.35 / IMI 108563 / JCM 9778 / NBRC 8474) TaxID=1097556 RepID=R4XC40_TAPDE|nr:Putative uncharacterized protein [Taphrina deformans PYCC 5710]|eukprot:CCG80905.1 Putative uncharacterized protein [Taphrina deformans PYCC 5710]
MDLLGRSSKPQAARAPNIIVHVSLDQPNVNFNFAALAEAKYGWDALHPVAARLRAINRYESEDESDSEAPIGDGQPAENGILGNTKGDGSGTELTQTKKKRKRRKDLEYYDINDPFIDDDELVLQERTAASKDGFFVFQGPLVAEGEKVRIEKADGTQVRGAGRGSRGGRSSRARSSTGRVSRSRTNTTRTETTAVSEEPQATTNPPAIGTDGVGPDAVALQEASTAVHVAGSSKTRVPHATEEVNSSTTKQKKRPHSGSETPSPDVARKRQDAATSSPLINPPSPVSISQVPSTGASTPDATASRKRQPPTTTLLKRAEKAGATGTPRTADKTPSLHASNPFPMASPSPDPSLSASAKRQRKPAREKTIEEKAELARRARESRERKRLAKQAQERAMLARADPAIDTSSITAKEARPSPAKPSARAAATPERTPQQKAKLAILAQKAKDARRRKREEKLNRENAAQLAQAASASALQETQQVSEPTGGLLSQDNRVNNDNGAVTEDMQKIKDESLPAQDINLAQDKSKTAQVIQELKGTSSPSGRSMSVNALLAK